MGTGDDSNLEAAGLARQSDEAAGLAVADGPEILITDEVVSAGNDRAIVETLSAHATQMSDVVTKEELNAVVNSLNANFNNSVQNLETNMVASQIHLADNTSMMDGKYSALTGALSSRKADKKELLPIFLTTFATNVDTWNVNEPFVVVNIIRDDSGDFKYSSRYFTDPSRETERTDSDFTVTLNVTSEDSAYFKLVYDEEQQFKDNEGNPVITYNIRETEVFFRKVEERITMLSTTTFISKGRMNILKYREIGDDMGYGSIGSRLYTREYELHELLQ